MKYNKAVLFDFDGVLGDTMNENYAAWSHAFEKRGLAVDKREFFAIEGFNTRKIAQHFLEKNGAVNFSWQEIVEEKEIYFIKNCRHSLYPSAFTTLEALTGKYLKKTGVVTGAGLDRLQKTVPSDFLKFFDVIISGDMIKNPKPAPEPYLLAAEKIQLTPEQCVVVENAPMGIKSAKAAGMYCIAITSTLTKEELNEADHILTSLAELIPYLEGFYGKTS